MFRRLLAAFWLLCVSSFGATWYVDPYATGSNSGTSWTNAWIGSAAVNWASVTAGDTIYLSGGTGSKLYLTNFLVNKDGTAGNPITVKVGRDAGHNGVVIFTNCTIGPVSSRPNWVVIDGSRSDSFVAPTNFMQVTNGATCITNNIGIWIKDLVSTSSASRVTSPCAVFFRRPNNFRMSWVEISGMTNAGTHSFHELDGTAIYIDMSSEGTNIATGNVFEYMYMHGNMGQQVSTISGVQTNFDHFQFRYMWMPGNGEDHFECSGGVTVRDSVIGPQWPNGVHNDMFQFTGNYIKVYNNWIGESQNSIMRIQTDQTELRHTIYFYNNIYSEKLGRALGGGILTEPLCVVHFDPLHPTLNGTISNVVFANNLFYNTVSNVVVTPPELHRNAVIYWSKGAITNAEVLQQIKWVNNLVVDTQKGVSMPFSTNYPGNTNGYASFSTNDVWADFNVVAATNQILTAATQMAYMDQTNIFWGGTNAFKFSNTTNYPVFIDAPNGDFELSAMDTVARNTGYDMSVLFNYDALNRPRSIGGVWDRGPLEAQGTGLLLWLRFEDDFSDSMLDDSSGQTNHAYRFGRPGSVYPTNWPTQVSVSVASGGNQNGGSSGDFKWYPDGWGIYGRSGAYAAVTNVQAFTNLPSATLSVWAHYATVKRIDNSYDYSQDGNATLVSAGTSSGVLGAWDLGRFNQAIWLNNTRFYVTTNSDFGVAQVGSESDPVFGKAGKAVFNFPDNGYADGETTGWHLYSVTFSNGVVRTYYDGTNYGSANLSSAITNLTVGWNNNVSVSTAFIGIGCDTHGGTPALEDEAGGPDYPNNGFFNGQMDDVRIYNRVLSDSEVLSVYTSGGAWSGGGGSSAGRRHRMVRR